MHFRRFLRFIFVVVLLFGMFGICSSTIYRSGWSQGFASGQIADGPALENPPGAVFSGPGPFLGGILGLFGWIIGAFFKFWLFVFFMGLLFKVLFGRRWHHRGRHWKGDHRGWHHWQQHHHGRHDAKGKGWQGKGWQGQDWDFKGNRPPWFDDSDGEPVMKA